MEFFLNGTELSFNSLNLINYSSMNRIEFKDPVCYLYLAVSVVRFWPLKQGVAGANNLFHKKAVSELREKHLVKASSRPKFMHH